MCQEPSPETVHTEVQHYLAGYTKFFETIRLSECDAITSGRLSLSSALEPLQGSGGFEVQTCPFLPEDDEHILLEIDIADENVPPSAEYIVEETYGRHFLLTKSTIDHACVRRVTESELFRIAKEELDLPMLPFSERVRDAIAHCPKKKRRGRFGRWLMAAFEEREAESARRD